MRDSRGGGQSSNIEIRKTDPSDVLLPPGYRIEVLADGFTFPSDIVFDESGTPYILEAGYAYGEAWAEPRLIKLEGNSKTIIAKGERNGPWTGVTYHDGNFYVSEGGEADGGRILRISPKGEIIVLVENLPSVGDHHTNVPIIKDGYLYFGQGTATNSGIVGEDNAKFGWLMRKPKFHDIPCGDIILTGENFESLNVQTEDSLDTVFTGAYSSFGVSTDAGTVIKGNIPCTGAIMRIPINGGDLEVVAWGLRNPFGLAISPDGKLYTTENSYDERGSRPVWGSGDVLWQVKENVWYGWPDFSAGKAIVNNDEFRSSNGMELKPLLKVYPNAPPKPVAILGVHSSSNGLAFSTNESFGYHGEAFIAQFGDMAPNAGKVMYPVGYKVVRVNVNSGVIRDFAVNKGKRNGPASWLETNGLERPISVKFDSDGKSLYLVDFGIVRITDKGTESKINTGVVWKIVKED